MSNLFLGIKESIYYPILRNLIIKKIVKESDKCTTIDNYVDLSFDFMTKIGLKRYPFRIKPIQIKDEIKELLNLLQNYRITKLLEIGTAMGGTLFLFSRIATENAKIISIDLPEGSFEGGYPKWKIPIYKSFSIKNQEIILINEDSHKPQTFRKVKEKLGREKLDFLFIDGDHSYDGVKKDFEIYSKLLKNNGIIAFHDIVPNSRDIDIEVSKFWNEIKNSYNHVEIVKDWKQGGWGIGVLFLK